MKNASRIISEARRANRTVKTEPLCEQGFQSIKKCPLSRGQLISLINELKYRVLTISVELSDAKRELDRYRELSLKSGKGEIIKKDKLISGLKLELYEMSNKATILKEENDCLNQKVKDYNYYLRSLFDSLKAHDERVKSS